MNKMIPYGKQFIDKDDIDNIGKTLKGNFLTTGPLVEKFENKINSFLNSKYSIVCNSGTSAIHLACLAVDIKKDDIVIMPAINFISFFNICNILGAKIKLADVDPETGRMRPEDVNDCIKKNNLKKIKAIIIMHLGGAQDHAIEFYKLKKKYKCFLIEDACHAFGSNYKYKKKNLKIGCAKHVDISTFSFHPIKSITTAEGGAITTNVKKFYDKTRLLRSHGLLRSSLRKHWDYDIVSSGYNFRLSDLNCSLGISQLNKINYFINQRKKIAKFYNKIFRSKKINIQYPSIKSGQNAWHLYIVMIKFNTLSQKDSFFSYMKNNGIIVQFHYKPIYKFKIGKKFKKLSGCEIYNKTAVSLPIYVELNEKAQIKIVNLISNFLTRNKIK